MLFVKNISGRERTIRLALGLIGLALAAMTWGTSEIVTGLGVMGAMLAMTGLMGFCPMCAVAGRKLSKGQ